MAKPSAHQFVLLAALLRPVARFCLRHGLHIQDLLEVAKQAFLRAAEEEMSGAGSKSNVSRLSAATGIHRRDVMRIVKRGELKTEPQGLISRVLGQWQYDRKFLNDSGRPRKLSFEGEKNEFSRLVQKVSNDLNPGTLLYELERLGAVERKGNTLALRARAYRPDGDEEASYRLLAKDVGALTDAVEENIANDPEVPNLHAATEFDNVRLDALPGIRRWLLEEGSKFHDRVRAHLARFDADITPGAAKKPSGARVVFCSFGLTEEPTK